MAMKERHRKAMFAIRAIGPCSNKALASALRISAADCYRLVGYLRTKGWMDRIGEELYAVTAEGRRELLVGSKPMDVSQSLFEEASCQR